MDTIVPQHPGKAHRGLRILILSLVFSLPLPPVLASVTHATPKALTSQRQAFIKAYASAKQGGQDWRAMASGLKHYPLYPYLPAAALEHDLKTVTPAQVETYLKRWPRMLPATDLRRHFLNELARRKDWKTFLAMYHPGMGSDLACKALQARLAGGARLHFKRDLAKLWRHASLPASCTPVQQWAHKHGLLTRARLWQRIDHAADAGRGGTVAALAKWLHGEDAVRAQRLAEALRQPARAVHDALRWPDTSHSRHAASIAMHHLTRKSSARAAAAWPALRKHLHFSGKQRDGIEHDLALFRATNFTDNAIAKLRALPAAAQSDSTRGWRLRVALARRDWQAVLDAWAAMPVRQQKDPEWRYFHARALDQLGYHQAARKIFDALAGKTTYFGFLAADRAHVAYTICPDQLAGDPAQEQALLKNPGLNRAFELFAVNLPSYARREWSRALHGASARKRRLAATLAWRRGWYDRAIFTFSSGDAMHLYRQRFPLARQDHVSAKAKAAGIDPAWAYAIIRAESAWAADAHSGAGAWGLMQLMPYTAREVARSQKLAYDGVDQLLDPKLNIALGTHYLGQMAARYGGAPWLASAAYNAGPQQVDKWLSARGDLPPDVFVATMPFHETRDYVARVMAFSVIYDWRLHGRVIPLSQRMPRFGQPYTPPDAKTPRRAMTCPASDTPAPAARAAHPAKTTSPHAAPAH